jgi:hypothetical protein
MKESAKIQKKSNKSAFLPCAAAKFISDKKFTPP